MKRLFLSDIHIGSKRSQYKKLKKLIEDENPDELYLVGDIIDLWKESFENILDDAIDFLTFLHTFSFQKPLYYIIGNHDDSLKRDSFIFEKFNFSSSLEIDVGNKTAKLIHGHQYDDFVIKFYPVARFFAFIDSLLMKFGLDWYKLKFSLASKQKTSIFPNVMKEVEEKAVEDNKRFNILIMGHTHIFKNIKIDNTRYINLGDWVAELSFAVQEDERIIVKKYKDNEYGDCIHS